MTFDAEVNHGVFRIQQVPRHKANRQRTVSEESDLVWSVANLTTVCVLQLQWSCCLSLWYRRKLGCLKFRIELLMDSWNLGVSFSAWLNYFILYWHLQFYEQTSLQHGSPGWYPRWYLTEISSAHWGLASLGNLLRKHFEGGLSGIVVVPAGRAPFPWR
jgi:hypothetical protein